MMDFVDPTIPIPGRKQIEYSPRPASFTGLRIGLVENTKQNSEAVLRRFAEKCEAVHGMTVEVLVHKPQRGPLTTEQVAQLSGRVDFAITGVGD